MEKLNTIQKREKLNTVMTVGEKGNGNAYHEYVIMLGVEDNKDAYKGSVYLHFQNGGRNIEGSVHGLTGEDLLEICRHRLQCFQTSEYACRENAVALTHIEEALMWLNRRVEDRIERNVLGINSK
jgi:hypothetical protein